MSERPSQTKQIIEMLGVINERLARIETKVEYQPKIDEKRFEKLEQAEVTCKRGFDEKLSAIEADVNELKAKPGKRWDTLIGGFISAAIGGLVGYFMKQ
jgi:hypothetical protein